MTATPLGGIGLPTLLLAVQLVVGAGTAVDLARTVARRRRVGVSALGQAILALLLLTLGVDGLFLGLDVVGQLVYATDLDPSLARPALIAVLLGSAALASLDR
ncbi:MAG TPA: hypothetical protein VGL23_02940 [Chloroflexota bacterium]